MLVIGFYLYTTICISDVRTFINTSIFLFQISVFYPNRIFSKHVCANFFILNIRAEVPDHWVNSRPPLRPISW